MKPTPLAEQAGAIPFRYRGGRLEILLVTTTSGRWGIPKGKLERGESAVATARREAWEEAGIRGTIDTAPLAWYRHPKGSELEVVVSLYPLAVTRVDTDFPEAGQRRRAWFPLREAAGRVGAPSLVAPLLALLIHEPLTRELMVRALREQSDASAA